MQGQNIGELMLPLTDRPEIASQGLANSASELDSSSSGDAEESGAENCETEWEAKLTVAIEKIWKSSKHLACLR